VEVGAETKFIEAEETEDGSIFRISPTCILNEMLSSSNDLVAHFGRDIEQLEDPLQRPPIIRLAATIDGGALTCHKGFIIYGIKFVQQREFVNLILGKDIFDGDADDVEGVQSVRLIQMLGFCQGDDDLEHNKRLADKFFKELQKIEKDGHFYVEQVNKYFLFEIIYVMDMKAQWLCCQNGGASYNVRFFCNHCPCRPETRHFPSYVRCVHCQQHHPTPDGKVCRHSPEWTEDMIDEYVDMQMKYPARTYWAFQTPKSSDNVDVWKRFVIDVLGIAPEEARTGDMAKKTVKNWLLEYDLLESDSSMMEERLFTWQVIIENLRVRRVDTRAIVDHGKPVVGGIDYDTIRIDAALIDTTLGEQVRYSKEEARLILKYVMVMGNHMAYAKHVSSKTDRMCTKIENVMECGLHLDNRIGHKQFQDAVNNTCEVGSTETKIQRIKRISDILCRALSHIPLDGNDEMLTASYSLKYDAGRSATAGTC